MTKTPCSRGLWVNYSVLLAVLIFICGQQICAGGNTPHTEEVYVTSLGTIDGSRLYLPKVDPSPGHSIDTDQVTMSSVLHYVEINGKKLLHGDKLSTNGSHGDVLQHIDRQFTFVVVLYTNLSMEIRTGLNGFVSLQHLATGNETFLYLRKYPQKHRLILFVNLLTSQWRDGKYSTQLTLLHPRLSYTERVVTFGELLIPPPSNSDSSSGYDTRMYQYPIQILLFKDTWEGTIWSKYKAKFTRESRFRDVLSSRVMTGEYLILIVSFIYFVAGFFLLSPSDLTKTQRKCCQVAAKILIAFQFIIIVWKLGLLQLYYVVPLVLGLGLSYLFGFVTLNVLIIHEYAMEYWGRKFDARYIREIDEEDEEEEYASMTTNTHWTDSSNTRSFTSRKARYC